MTTLRRAFGMRCVISKSTLKKISRHGGALLVAGVSAFTNQKVAQAGFLTNLQHSLVKPAMTTSEKGAGDRKTPPAEDPLEIPQIIPAAADDGIIYFSDAKGQKRPTTLNNYMQTRLQAFLAERGNPIATVVVAEARTGRILALVQGRNPETWGSQTHSALHNKFPAASLFKTILTAAAFEVLDYDPNTSLALQGGCANVQPNGIWLQDSGGLRRFRGGQSGMTLRRAYALSCNNFFARMAVENLGLGIITEYASKFGWNGSVTSDFAMEQSPIALPVPESSSVFTVGRFSAGFGLVNTSAVHIAWQMLALANDGVSRPLLIQKDSPSELLEQMDPKQIENHRMVSADTAHRIRSVMSGTVHGGTATSAFGHGKYRRLRDFVGGKTGTLTGKSPAGLTTLFEGMMPLDDPEIVVAAIVMLQDRWIVKAPILAAEAFNTYYEMQLLNDSPVASSSMPKRIGLGSRRGGRAH